MSDAPAEVLDGTVVPDEPADVSITPEPGAAAQSTAVARRERRSEVIRPLDADQLVESFHEYQALLPKLLNDADYQAAGKDKDGRPKRFVKKSGWRKIATAFDLDVQIIRSEVERDDAGQPCRAEVWARAIAPSGRAMDGDGYCSVDEERFSGPRGNRSKLENDLRATATTRAMNRAISGLVGMGEVSAEEVDGSAEQAAAPAEASAELQLLTANVVLYLLDGDTGAADATVGVLLKQFDGKLPAIAGQALVLVAKAVKDARAQAVPQ